MAGPRITTEPAHGSIILSVEGVTLADSSRALVLREGTYPPVVYFPRADVAMDRLTRMDRITHCPHKGDASYWSAEVDGRMVDIAAWSYEDPDKTAAEPIRGLIAFYLDNLGPNAKFEGPGVPTT